MAGDKTMRLNKVLRELNISLDRAVEHLGSKGVEIEARPTTKISQDEYDILFDTFASDANKKAASKEVGEEKRKEKMAMRLEAEAKIEKQRQEELNRIVKAKAEKVEVKTIGKIELDKSKEAPVAEKTTEDAPKEEVAKKVSKDVPVVEKAAKEVSKETAPVKEVAAEKEAKAPVEKTSASEKGADTVVRAKKHEFKIVDKIELPVEKPRAKKGKPAPKSTTKSTAKPAVKKVEETKAPAKVEATKPVAKIPGITKKETPKEVPPEEVKPAEPQSIATQYKKLDGPRLTGQKIDLKQFERPKKKKPVANDKGGANSAANKRKRKRIVKPGTGTQGANQRPGQGGQFRGGGKPGFNKGGKGRSQVRKPLVKEEPTAAEVQKQIRETLEKLQGKSKKNKGAKHRRDKRDLHRQQSEKDLEQQAAESKVIKVTEFVTVSEVATMMNIPVTNIISSCMMLGMMVTMNQRLDAETLTIVADEFGYTLDFVSAEVEDAVQVIVDKEEDLEHRAPVVTVMGHVDHGKTSLLDYIRQENVIAGESGGITQHIGAYGVELKGGQKMAFLDTPGHEAFTAMRARGGQVADIVIVVVAADDDVMPQTKEAISHAQAAGVPIIFAINKVDKPDAKPEKIKEQLAAMNLLVEDWGGKIQSHDISAKTGLGVDDLLEKVLLEAEMLELKANPNKLATGTVVEASLDKGRGYVSTILVQEGTLRIGDFMLAGKNSGKIKAMFNERGQKMKIASPSTPVSILGLDGAPQAGDKFNVFEDEREAKQIANKRAQLQRELSVRTQRHITLDEIGRRIALGDFKELNIILKGDVDGSVEALTDSFQKLSTEEIQVNIIHKGVGAITESDVLLASASEAIIIGFNVRPSGNAKMLADQEEIDIRTYSIIYAAIDDLKDAMEGMLSPELKEEVTGNVEIREVYKISKIGNIAGCMVMSGKIFRNSKIRILRENIVVHEGLLSSLKRFKDDVKEVAKGYDCGLQIKNYNDIRGGDVIEAFEEVKVKKTLK
ncbi:MAG: translation initiation factor IF-2 [Flavobacteriaceae bacterium]|nr:MAG: translation initiation factor IF-2 [Flavobacteriaceae bacterium]